MSKVKVGNIFLFLLSLSVLTMFLPPITLPIGGSSLIVHIGEIFLWICIVIWLANVIKIGNFTLNPIGKYALLFFVVSFLSIINANDLGRFFIGVLTYIEVTLAILMFSDIVYKLKFKKKIFKYFIYSAVILSLFIISKTLIENNGNFLLGSKIVLSIGGSNYLASILILPFFISLTYLLKYKLSLRILIPLSLICIAIIYTASRTAYIIVFSLTAIFIIKDLIFSRKIGLIKRVSSLILIILGLGLVYVIGNEFISQMIQAGRFSNLNEQSNLLSRFDIFEEYFEAFMNHPFVGNGFLNVNALGANNLAHNFIFQILGDNGFIALLIYLGLLFKIYRFLGKSYRLTDDIEIKYFILGYKRGFIAVLLHGMLEPNFGTKLFMLYLFIGLGFIITTVIESKEINHKYSKNTA